MSVGSPILAMDGCRVHRDMAVTERQSKQFIRLPLWIAISDSEPSRMVAVLQRAVAQTTLKRPV